LGGVCWSKIILNETVLSTTMSKTVSAH